MKAIRMVVKLQNNLLKARREALGLSTIELSEKVGMSYGVYVSLENLRCTPTSKKDKSGWCPSAQLLAKFYRVLPEDLFPEVVLAVDKPMAERSFDAEEIRALIPDSLRRDALGPQFEMERKQLEGLMGEALMSLSPIESEVLTERFGLGGDADKTLDEIGVSLGKSPERIRQIQEMALRKLRHPSRSKKFFAFASEAGCENPYKRDTEH
jgi:RNA polymerase primary sigma factor